MLTPDLERIPSELKALPQWVCHRQNKIPVDPKTGDNAKADDQSTWGEFPQAVAYWKGHQGNGIVGIGFEFSPGDPYTGIDLDKCRNPETGEIEPWALEIVRRLNSFTEVSPSGTGLHIWIKGKLPRGARRKGKVEMYNSGRYFTVTGHHLEGTPTTIEDRQAELTILHEEIFGKHSEEPKQGPGRDPKSGRGAADELSDEELIERIRLSKNGNKFTDLMLGDLYYLKQRYGYPSASEADLALVLILVFWVGKDAERIDRLFRRSGLMRDKWDEYRGDQTYGELTIAKAIAGTKKVWEGPKRKRQASKNQNNAPKNNSSTSVNLIDELNKKHAVVMIGGKCAIMNEITDPVSGRPDITFSSIFDFKNYYSNKKVEFINE